MNSRARTDLPLQGGPHGKRPGYFSLALLGAAVLLAALVVQVSPAAAATLTVNTADDAFDGACTASHCSLREAIDVANDAADTDTIRFGIPGDGPHTIHVASSPAWWRLLHPVTIDGTTQPGYAGKPIIELDGSLSTPRQGGLAFFGGSSTVRGLVVNRFKGAGISLEQKGNYVVEDNYIGTDVTGTLARGNGEGGVFVFTQGPGAFDNAGNTIARNVISANGLAGITLGDDRNVVQGNHIGTDVSGTLALGNGREGIRMGHSHVDNVIGGTAPGAGNVISANGDNGIETGTACNPCEISGDVIQGNYIGTNASGTAALGNALNGIFTNGDDETIGGTSAAARNIISANGLNGILLFGPTAASRVQGNLIGTAADGTTALGNGRAGIHAARADGTAIGGTAPGAGNTIAYNRGDGVLVGHGSAFTFCCGNAILSNSIFSNGELGIDLDTGTPPASGVRPNDPGDVDRGPNELQNFPVLSSASGNTIVGTLNSLASTTFRLEFFANSEADPSGHGEGERFLGATTVTTDGAGNASFGFGSPTSFGGSYVSATATDPAGNTSEFSGVLFVAGHGPPAPLGLSPASATNYVGEEHCVTATVRDGSGNPMSGVSVRFSVSGVNSASGSATTAANGEARFCYTGTNPGPDTITAYADLNDNGTKDEGEPAAEAEKAWLVPPAAPPFLLLIDESSIDNGSAPNRFSGADVNDTLAALGLRTPLPAFDAANVGRRYTLHTGQVGDEGWFAPKTIPSSWAAAGPTLDGVRNFLGSPRESYPHGVGPGVGTPDAKGDRESLLDKVPGVTPLRATALEMLADSGAILCAVVYDGGIGINYGPLSGSLKGANLGTVALRVLSATPLFGHSTGSLPQLEVEVLDAGTVCEQELQLFADAPEPASSSSPYDTGRPATG